MGKEVVEAEGVVAECLPGARFLVTLTGESYQGHQIMAHISGKMRQHFIKILPGDKVIVEITPYDLNQGRIKFRQR